MKLEKLKREIKAVKNKIDCMWIIVAFLSAGLAIDIAVAVLNSTSIFNIICFIPIPKLSFKYCHPLRISNFL